MALETGGTGARRGDELGHPEAGLGACWLAGRLAEESSLRRSRAATPLGAPVGLRTLNPLVA